MGHLEKIYQSTLIVCVQSAYQCSSEDVLLRRPERPRGSRQEGLQRLQQVPGLDREGPEAQEHKLEAGCGSKGGRHRATAQFQQGTILYDK